jgi:hypothetical protein
MSDVASTAAAAPTPSAHRAEAAALFRDNRAAFVANVNTSLRGGRVGQTVFERMV